MMIYQFKCSQHGYFEVRQGILEEHKAWCPLCFREGERIYSDVIHYWPDVLWNKDGSKQSPDELPPVGGGHPKYYPGF